MEKSRREEIIKLIQQEVVPALGCTEPIAVALAVAKAREVLGVVPEKVLVCASANIFKNAMGVGIPGTGMVGMHIAAALGMVTGKSSDSLELLKNINEDDIQNAKDAVEKEIVKLELKVTDQKLYIEAHCYAGEHEAIAVISGLHNHFSLVSLDKKILEESNLSEDSKGEVITADVLVDEIYEFATQTPVEEIRFMLKGAQMNKALSDYGLEHRSGLAVGANLLKTLQNEKVDINTKIMSATAAASDARMSGAMLPAMSNSGSGNQGITAMVPLVVYAKEINATEEQLIRALTISNLVVIHIKKQFGRLSAACGCVVASTGAACGIAYLMGGKLDNIKYAIQNMIANLTGMLCDGAKLGCALKVSTGTYSAIQSAVLAMQGVYASSNDGIIDDNVEKSISNIAKLSAEGMNETDKLVLKIMTSKN